MAAPVTLTEAKAHCRVTNTSEEALIGSLIAAAQGWVENFTGLLLDERDVTETFDAFTNPLRLTYWPVAPDADYSVSYTDSNGEAAEVTDARLTVNGRSARLSPAFSSTWPVPYYGSDAVSVTYTAGYEDPEDVPQPLKQAMLLLIGGWYDQRSGVAVGAPSSEIPLAVESLCRPFRTPTI